MSIDLTLDRIRRASSTKVEVLEEAGEKYLRCVSGNAAGKDDKLVILAGGLYLVADFYRSLNNGM